MAFPIQTSRKSGGSGVTFVKLSLITINSIDVIKGICNLRRGINGHEIDVVHCHHRMVALYMKFYRTPF